MIGLDLEDFRRLGVRPHECRLTVIRQAAARSSKALADRQLTEPSPQVGLQLSRVATSAYRLLDPRQRHDAAQRAHVGRILPNMLSWAGQTSFHTEQATSSIDAVFSDGAVSDAELVEMLDLDTSPRAASNESSWTVTLNDDDLLEVARHSRERVRLRHAWAWLSLAGLAVGTLLGLATLRYGDDPALTAGSSTVPRSTTISEPGEQQSPEPQPATPAQESASPAQEPAAPEQQPASPEPEPASPEQGFPTPQSATTTPAESTPETSPEESPQLSASGPASESAMDTDVSQSTPDGDASPGSAIATTTPSDTSSSNPASPSPPIAEVGEPAADDLAAVDRDGFLPDPFLSLPPDAPPMTSEITQPIISPMAKRDIDPTESSSGEDAARANQASDDGKRYSAPDDAAARAARTQLVLLLPDLANSIAANDVPARIAQVEALEGELTIGSAEQWVARMLVAELVWPVEDLADVRQRLKPLAARFDTPDGRPLAESFIAACDTASLPETHEHLLGNGLQLADYLLMNQSPRLCKQVVEAMGRSIAVARPETARAVADDRAGSNRLGKRISDDSLRRYLDEFSQAADQMERLGESARRMRGDDGEVDDSSGNVGILGRYYCLMLRQWDVGLPWLAEVSDSRIASVARSENELGQAATPDELMELAQRWMSAASRSRGRASDSMRLHAMEILQQVAESTSGLKKLESERRIDESSKLLPPFLRQASLMADASVVEVSAAPTEREPDPSMLETSKRKRGLSGRIKIGDEDIGVQLDYELGVAMTQSVLDRIAERLDRQLTRMTITFTGEIELAEPAQLIVSIAPSPQDVVQDVRIDDSALEFDPQTMTTRVALEAGKHEIAWSMEAERIALATLGVHDAASGQRTSVAQPAGSDQPARANKLTVAMVRKSP